VPAPERITRDDLESKFRELEGEAVETAEHARSYAIVVAVVAVAAVIAVGYVLGRRRGLKKTTIVEIKRF
jgi:hypothetical protein